MFDFEKFHVYVKTEYLIERLQPVLGNKKINSRIRDQFYRASSSILLNIAEGAGKYSKRDKKNYYVIARGSAQECVAIINLLKIEQNIDKDLYKDLYDLLVEISKMLSGLINSMRGK